LDKVDTVRWEAGVSNLKVSLECGQSCLVLSKVGIHVLDTVEHVQKTQVIDLVVLDTSYCCRWQRYFCLRV